MTSNFESFFDKKTREIASLYSWSRKGFAKNRFFSRLDSQVHADSVGVKNL